MPTAHDAYPILIGFDSTESGYNALASGVRAAARHAGSSIHVVTVFDQNFLGKKLSGPPSQESMDEAHEKTRREVLSRMAPDILDVVPVAVHVLLGKPKEEILRMAGLVGAHLIVVGTHGRTGGKRMLLGSVAESIVREAHCGVLVARSERYTSPQQEGFVAEPPCERCMALRKETAGERWWCDIHDAPYVPPTHYGTHSSDSSAKVGSILW